MSEPLSQREFDTWTKAMDGKIDMVDRKVETLLDYMSKQVERNLAVENRLTAVETEELRNKRVSVGSVIAAIITAALTALTAYGSK